MKNTLMMTCFVFLSGSLALANELKEIKCSNAVYGILHQSCVLPMDQQEFILAADKCSADATYENYIINLNGYNYQYNVTNCAFQTSGK